MESQTLKTDLRDKKGSANVRRLRSAGKVPGVLYGHGEAVIPLLFSADDLREFLEGGHHLVTLDLNGQEQPALVREVQYDSWGRSILHVDFARVALDETVTLSIEIVSHGTPKALLAGGVLEQPLHHIEVECRAVAIPDAIRVEVGNLEVNQMIHVRDVVLPEGVKALMPPDTIVFIVQEARKEVEAPVAVAPEGVAASEPEIIGRRVKEEGSEEEKS